MSRYTQEEDEFCLQCHWEAFKMNGDNPMLTEEDFDGQNPWNYPHAEGSSHSHVPCELDEPCCDADDCSADGDACSVQCSSACDGFVGCDASTVCSESHCDALECEKVAPVCFDKSCIGDDHDPQQDLAGLLGEDEPFNWDATNFLPSTTSTTFENIHSHDKIEDYSNVPGFSLSGGLFPAPSTSDAANNSDFSHLEFHCPPKESNTNLGNQAYAGPGGFNSDMYDILGFNHNFTACNHQHNGTPAFTDNNNSDKHFCFPSTVPHSQCHTQHQHQHSDSCFSMPVDPRRYPSIGNMHHTHHNNHYSASSVSSTPLHSTPLETPPPQRSEMSSPLTSPDYVPQDNSPTICKWVSKKDGSASICGALLSGAGALQEHLVSKHIGTVDGLQGHGYYCRWEGCSRPHEPFSQKSKLQGHFLTHSNYKSFSCSTCGKSFARQATLERHERSHRGDKPYKCKECGKSFTDSSELKTHMRTHTGEKPFKCKYPGCGFETGDSSNMSSHKLTHGERRHKCPAPGCSKSFTRPDQLKRHLKTTHNKQDTPSSSTLTSPSTQQIPLPSFQTTF